MALEITSPAFKNNENVPVRYTCQGEDISPALQWSGAPNQTKSFVLIVDDPDAPSGDWVHWLVYGIPAQINSFRENESQLITFEKSITNTIKQGRNSGEEVAYGGPCPPPGKPHRYFFKLYCLDTVLYLNSGLTKYQLLRAIEGHVLEKAQLIGLYKR